MKILFDTNIILDHLLDRQPFNQAASQLFAFVEKGQLMGYMGATTITTTHYLISRSLDKPSAKKVMSNLLHLFEIAPVTRPVIEDAVAGKLTDFEDAVLYQCALHSNVDAIVSRDKVGFKNAKLPVYSSEELVKILKLR